MVYTKNKKGNIEYLILKRKLHWVGWEFPKGGVEKKEKIFETVKREINEETKLVPLSLKKFNVSGKYKYSKDTKDRPGIIGQTYEALYAVEVKKTKVFVDNIEHSDYMWVNFRDAHNKLTWKNQKECLKIVDEWLGKRKFREYITKSGTSIWVGKDRKQNDSLVRSFIGKDNIIFHTKASGSPFCILENEKPSKSDLKEASIVCAKHSQDWRDNKTDIIVHKFTGKDIYKKKSMGLGTFGVRKSKDIKVKKGDILNLEKKHGKSI